ncbi:MAG: hypothetical protein KN64_02850 [Sulfurovum sp. AS07-7]|nr:MAG: hypothetical protein KN64_02850 [Sulfurovum sp. AS07-7]
MRLGLYIVASLVFMGILGAFVYSINAGSFSYEVFGIPLNLPIAVWMIIPVAVFMLLSVFHLSFYGMKNFFRNKKWIKDSQALNDSLYWSVLGEPKATSFNTELKDSASLLSNAKIEITNGVDGLSPKLTEALNLKLDIESGKYVDLKANKLAKVLSKDNPLVVKNNINKIETDALFAEEVMKNRSNYSDAIFAKALSSFASKTDFVKAKKYIKSFDRASFLTLLNRVSAEDSLAINKDNLNEFVSQLKSDLKCSDFMAIVNIAKSQFTPDDNLKLFKAYASENEKAETAYLYLLLEYEMISKAQEFLDEQGSDEFVRFRAFLELKKKNAQYKITDLMRTHQICNDA